MRGPWPARSNGLSQTIAGAKSGVTNSRNWVIREGFNRQVHNKDKMTLIARALFQIIEFHSLMCFFAARVLAAKKESLASKEFHHRGTENREERQKTEMC